MQTKYLLTIVITIILLSTNCLSQISQCDSLKFYYSTLDATIKNDLESLKFDTILVVQRSETVLTCYKYGGQFYFKKYIEKGDKITTSEKISSNIKKQLKTFFLEDLFKTATKLEKGKAIMLIDDGPARNVIYKTINSCWYYEYYLDKKSTISVWTNKLFDLMK